MSLSQPGIHRLQLVGVTASKIVAEKLMDGETGELPSEVFHGSHLNTKVSYHQDGPTDLQIKLEATLEFPPDAPRPIDLSVGIIGRYHSSEAIEEQQIPALLHSHSYPLLWPYIRELVSNVTMRMGGPVITLPTLRITSQASEPKKGGQRRRQPRPIPSSAPQEDEKPERF